MAAFVIDVFLLLALALSFHGKSTAAAQTTTPPSDPLCEAVCDSLPTLVVADVPTSAASYDGKLKGQVSKALAKRLSRVHLDISTATATISAMLSEWKRGKEEDVSTTARTITAMLTLWLLPNGEVKAANVNQQQPVFNVSAASDLRRRLYRCAAERIVSMSALAGQVIMDGPMVDVWNNAASETDAAVSPEEQLRHFAHYFDAAPTSAATRGPPTGTAASASMRYAVWLPTPGPLQGCPSCPGLTSTWSYLGPLVHGKTEYDGDPLWSALLHPLMQQLCGKHRVVAATSVTAMCVAEVSHRWRSWVSVIHAMIDRCGHSTAAAPKGRAAAAPPPVPWTQLVWQEVSSAWHAELFKVANEASPAGQLRTGFVSTGQPVRSSVARELTVEVVQTPKRDADGLSPLVQQLGTMSALEFVGWATTQVTLVIPSVPLKSGAAGVVHRHVTVSVHAPGVNSVWYALDGGDTTPRSPRSPQNRTGFASATRSIAADQYHRGYVFSFPVYLQTRMVATDGPNGGARALPGAALLTIAMKLRGVAQAGLSKVTIAVASDDDLTDSALVVPRLPVVRLYPALHLPDTILDHRFFGASSRTSRWRGQPASQHNGSAMASMPSAAWISLPISFSGYASSSTSPPHHCGKVPISPPSGHVILKQDIRVVVVRSSLSSGFRLCVNAGCTTTTTAAAGFVGQRKEGVGGDGDTAAHAHRDPIPWTTRFGDDYVNQRDNDGAVASLVDPEMDEYSEMVSGVLGDEAAAWGGDAIPTGGADDDHPIAEGQLVPLRVLIGVVVAPRTADQTRGPPCAPSGAAGWTATLRVEARVTSIADGSQPSSWAASNDVTLTFRCRDVRRDTFRFNYIDADGSVSSGAARLPLPVDDLPQPGRQGLPWPCVLALHGTGVSASDQADSFKLGNAQGGYNFGVQGAWLVAPSRHGAHNWEGVGMNSALSALFHATLASRELTANSYGEQQQQQSPRSAGGGGGTSPSPAPPIDPLRIVYAGHSMGGHGAVHLAVLRPDRAIAGLFIAPWPSKEHYGRANDVFSVVDRSSSHVDGLALGQLWASVSDSAPDMLLRNLLHVPIFLRVGAADTTVPPFFARRMFRLLKQAGHPDVTYNEAPQKEHWWWDSHKPNDGGCMNDAAVRAFLHRAIARSWHHDAATGDEGESEATTTTTTTGSQQQQTSPNLRGPMSFRTISIDASPSGFGVRIVSQSVPQTLTHVSVGYRAYKKDLQEPCGADDLCDLARTERHQRRDGGSIASGGVITVEIKRNVECLSLDSNYVTGEIRRQQHHLTAVGRGASSSGGSEMAARAVVIDVVVVDQVWSTLDDATKSRRVPDRVSRFLATIHSTPNGAAISFQPANSTTTTYSLPFAVWTTTTPTDDVAEAATERDEEGGRASPRLSGGDSVLCRVRSLRAATAHPPFRKHMERHPMTIAADVVVVANIHPAAAATAAASSLSPMDGREIHLDLVALQRSYATYLANLHFVAYDSFVGIRIPSRKSTILKNSEKVRSSGPPPSLSILLLLGDAAEPLSGDGSQVVRFETTRAAVNGTMSGRVVATVTAASISALEHAVLEVGCPTVPPMMRAPFGNLLPGRGVLDTAARDEGLGSFHVLGY